MSLADVLRVICVAEALALMPICVASMFGAAMGRHQRARFLGTALIGVVVVGYQIEYWGNPLTWRLPVLTVALTLACYGAVMFLLRRRRAEHDYLSTACLHDEHQYCAAMTGYQGAKRPAQCKFCEARCVCPCHEPRK